ncbi:MAG: 1,4-dihydroxy-2-naphthoate polyprenyltransferase [uncultured Thermomicrobiales bacterium]|uniref:1,4-dihydroxy-2-naphthoate octaprenyltransferase n=1 Tax=uncultured Thermomicrobiales bacterium TaxID=1645740 RepID=A0A6J4UI18_9BACT|nr:MAG: 1,4-dihydroxy-2-naphthoate polyprenyltransferase [uncultured Thermomicrobiales bacterium]
MPVTSPPRPGTRTPPGPARAWLLAIRPKTLPAAIAPVVVGTALAARDDGFAFAAALAAIAVALLLQIAANLANDVFDFKRGADTADRVGPVRVAQAGLIPPARLLTATWAALAAATVPGLYLVWRGGWPLLVIGALALVAAVAYTGGPVPLGYLGLGDVAVFVFFGLVAVAGTYATQTRDFSALALAAAVPIGALATAILAVNNLRDVAGDRRAGKRTLAVRLGPDGARAEYVALLAAAYLSPPLLWLAGPLSAWALLPWLTLPLAAVLARKVLTETGAALNARLAGTARLEILFALLFAAGILL